MNAAPSASASRTIRTPLAAAVAGIVFSVLFAATRLRLVPRWLAVLGYATAAVLLLGVGLVPWLQLVFTGCVFTLSVHLLVITFRHSGANGHRS